jgi:hypothetical protein
VRGGLPLLWVQGMRLLRHSQGAARAVMSHGVFGVSLGAVEGGVGGEGGVAWRAAGAADAGELGLALLDVQVDVAVFGALAAAG